MKCENNKEIIEIIELNKKKSNEIMKTPFINNLNLNLKEVIREIFFLVNCLNLLLKKKPITNEHYLKNTLHL